MTIVPPTNTEGLPTDLTLTSTTPSWRNDAKTMGHDRMMCIAPNFGSRVIVCMPDHDRDNLIDDAVVDLIQQHWPVFDWKCSAETKVSAWAQSQADGLVFASLLKETILRMGVEREEGEMRDLAYLADTEDGAEHFERLTEFRRILARLHQSLGDAQSAFKTSSKAELDARGLVLLRGAGTTKQPATFMPEEAAGDRFEPQRPADFTKLHVESLQGLQERLDAIKEDLNEEIQLAIGSVQVHDAQTMKKQTTWTVVLTVLAAIYLPMTLVTGIFGMNITEISTDATAPNAWWAFGAWAVVFAVTLGGILVYVATRKWKAREKRKRKADLEAGRMSSTFVRKRAGGVSGKGVKRWARNLRQKTKKAWTPKRE
jgi:Mg2+ and Co2+ transporter CorA